MALLSGTLIACSSSQIKSTPTLPHFLALQTVWFGTSFSGNHTGNYTKRHYRYVVVGRRPRRNSGVFFPKHSLPVPFSMRFACLTFLPISRCRATL